MRLTNNDENRFTVANCDTRSFVFALSFADTIVRRIWQSLCHMIDKAYHSFICFSSFLCHCLSTSHLLNTFQPKHASHFTEKVAKERAKHIWHNFQKREVGDEISMGLMGHLLGHTQVHLFNDLKSLSTRPILNTKEAHMEIYCYKKNKYENHFAHDCARIMSSVRWMVEQFIGQNGYGLGRARSRAQHNAANTQWLPNRSLSVPNSCRSNRLTHRYQTNTHNNCEIRADWVIHKCGTGYLPLPCREQNLASKTMLNGITEKIDSDANGNGIGLKVLLMCS